jgi:hypothetical protein
LLSTISTRIVDSSEKTIILISAGAHESVSSPRLKHLGEKFGANHIPATAKYLPGQAHLPIPHARLPGPLMAAGLFFPSQRRPSKSVGFSPASEGALWAR